MNQYLTSKQAIIAAQDRVNELSGTQNVPIETAINDLLVLIATLTSVCRDQDARIRYLEGENNA